MELVTQSLEVVRGPTAERARWERVLAETGHRLPLPQRSDWLGIQPAQSCWLLLLRDRGGRPCGGVGLQVSRSRALPGHLLLRCERFGPGLSAEAQETGLRALAALARSESRVLRLYVETYSPDPARNAALSELAAELGFSPLHPPRCYDNTLLVDLSPTEDEIFAGLHGTARRHIRALGKNPLELRSITDPADFPRMDAIYRETFERTGVNVDRQDWAAIVRVSERDPSASRLIGVYRTDRDGPERLLAFAWGCGHGDHIHYSKAASTRDTDLKVPLMYPIIWDLIKWGKSNGARFFDFGGVTAGSHDSEDALGGISDFKRYFSKQVVQVGAEWAYEPRVLKARAAHAVTYASSLIARLAARNRPNLVTRKA